jgi:hypothetical protein
MLKELYEQAISLTPETQWPTFDGKLLDRSEFLTSSEVSKCLRWTYFEKNKEKFPRPVGKSGNNGYAERGHAIEAAFVKKIKLLEKYGYIFEYMGDDQRSFYDADLGLSGTPDGVMTDPQGKVWLLELKSIDPRFNKKNLPKKGHIPQTNQNIYLVNHCLGTSITESCLFYIDASDIWDTKEFGHTYSGEMLNVSIERAELLWGAESQDDLEPEGIYSGDCDLCPFTHHCSQTLDTNKLLQTLVEKNSPFLQSVEPTTLSAEQQELVDTFLIARNATLHYEKVKDNLSGEVKKLVIDNGGFLITEDHTVLKADLSAGRESIDKMALVALGVDLEAVTKQGKPFVTLTVKEPKE